jgi:hypothetical protein
MKMGVRMEESRRERKIFIMTHQIHPKRSQELWSWLVCSKRWVKRRRSPQFISHHLLLQGQLFAYEKSLQDQTKQSRPLSSTPRTSLTSASSAAQLTTKLSTLAPSLPSPHSSRLSETEKRKDFAEPLNPIVPRITQRISGKITQTNPLPVKRIMISDFDDDNSSVATSDQGDESRRSSLTYTGYESEFWMSFRLKIVFCNNWEYRMANEKPNIDSRLMAVWIIDYIDSIVSPIISPNEDQFDKPHKDSKDSELIS